MTDLSQQPNSTQPHSPNPDSIASLLTEIITVSNQLRKTSFCLHRDGEGFPPGGIMVLQLLARHGPMTVPQIARTRRTSRQNIQMTVNRLKVGGWVSNESNPAHRRSDLVKLTSQGQKLFTEKIRFEEQLRAATSSAVGVEEALRTEEILARIRQALASVEKPAPAPATEVIEPEVQEIPPAGASAIRYQPEPSDNDLPVNLL